MPRHPAPHFCAAPAELLSGRQLQCGPGALRSARGRRHPAPACRRPDGEFRQALSRQCQTETSRRPSPTGRQRDGFADVFPQASRKTRPGWITPLPSAVRTSASFCPDRWQKPGLVQNHVRLKRCKIITPQFSKIAPFTGLAAKRCRPSVNAG